MELAISNRRRISFRSLTTYAWQVTLLAAAYVVTGALGMQLAHYRDGVTLIWAPTGLSLAAMILFGRRLWPGVFIGALAVSYANPATTLTAGVVLSSIGIAIGNCLEAVVGATLLERVAHFRPTLERMQDGVAFLAIGVIGCTAISATIGVGSMSLAGFADADSFGRMWLFWWMGDMSGALILTPALLMMVHGTPAWRSLASRVESWLVLSTLLAVGGFTFFYPGLGLMGYGASVAAVPVLVWAGIQLGPRGAVTASFITVAIATIATGQNLGPFVLGTTAEAMFILWGYASLIGITAFTLATVVEQRNLADRKYRLEERERLRSEKQHLLLLERERLTREMHDGLGGQLVSILAMVERGFASPSEIAEALRRAIYDIHIIIDSMDSTTTDLPTSLGRLRARIEPLLRRNGIALSWRVDERIGIDILSPEAVLHGLRIIQEAVTNALRHANANHVEVRVMFSDEEGTCLNLLIRDNGRGIPPDKVLGGRGFRNMHSRAEELGADIRIENTGSGTQVDLTVRLPGQSFGSRSTIP